MEFKETVDGLRRLNSKLKAALANEGRKPIIFAAFSSITPCSCKPVRLPDHHATVLQQCGAGQYR